MCAFVPDPARITMSAASSTANDRVQVIKSDQGWSCIVPPPGCFSWISMQYVSINQQNPTMGIVTGDNVGVYTGSDTQEAKYSTSKQVVLHRGQTVKLLGEEKDDYYKIAPPQGAYLWVSSQFLQPVDKPLTKAPAATRSDGSGQAGGREEAGRPQRGRGDAFGGSRPVLFSQRQGEGRAQQAPRRAELHGHQEEAGGAGGDQGWRPGRPLRGFHPQAGGTV